MNYKAVNQYKEPKPIEMLSFSGLRWKFNEKSPSSALKIIESTVQMKANKMDVQLQSQEEPDDSRNKF